MAILVLFEHNLRLDDNPLLTRAAQIGGQMLCVSLGDPLGQPGPFGLSRIGRLRQHFLHQARQELHGALTTMGQQLILIRQPVLPALSRLIDRHRITHLLRERPLASNELALSQQIKRRHPELIVEHLDGHTLFDLKQLPFEVDHLPSSYSAFRRSVTSLAVQAPLDPPSALPKAPPEASPWPHIAQHRQRTFIGGESQGQRQLAHYLEGPAPGHYKETRNELDGWRHSAKWSPWLAAGCLSPRRIWRALTHYEQSWGANDSTDWLKRELLWREYFQWYALKWGRRLFRFQGIGQKRPLTSFYPARFNQWCQGSTAFPLVNACMHELNETGYLSNRGRQLVASALVNELQLDWRCGAAYFEQQLIDYDVGSNWGNWQYIAGVGADPRGGRHFDLNKQSKKHDPQGRYTHKWRGDTQTNINENDLNWPGETL